MDESNNIEKPMQISFKDRYGIHGYLKAVKDLDLSKLSDNTTSTGFPELDNALGGGFQEGLIVLGAPPKAGKSMLACQIAQQMAVQQKDILYFSLEMPAMQVIARSVGRYTYQLAIEKCFSRIKKLAKSGRQLQNVDEIHSFNEDERSWIHEAATRFEADTAEHFYLIDRLSTKNICNVDVLCGVVKYACKELKSPIIFIDYLQFLTTSKNTRGDKERMDTVVQTLKELADSLHLTIVIISSLNRDSYKLKGKIDISSFKESGLIEYSASVGLALEPQDGSLLDSDNIKQITYPIKMQLRVLFNRSGEASSVVQFDYDPRYACFSGGLDDNPFF